MRLDPETGEVEEFPIPFSPGIGNITIPGLNGAFGGLIQDRLALSCAIRPGADGKMYACQSRLIDERRLLQAQLQHQRRPKPARAVRSSNTRVQAFPGTVSYLASMVSEQMPLSLWPPLCPCERESQVLTHSD